MPFWMLISDFLHDLKTQRTRALLTMFAITWGTIAIALMMAFGRGFKVRMVSAMTNAGNNIIHVWGGQTSKRFQGLSEGRRIRFKREDAEIILNSIPRVEAVSPTYGRWGVRLVKGNNTASTYLEGVVPNFEIMRTMYPQAGGRFINQRDMDEKRRAIFLGSVITEELFGKNDPIGQIVLLDGTPFTVIGILQKKVQLSMNNGPDDRRAIIPITTFESIYPHRFLNNIIVKPRLVSDTPHIKRELYRVFGQKFRFDPDDNNALSIWDMVENIQSMDNVFTGIEIFLAIIGGLTLIVAGVGVANIMYVVVKERTKEIGIKIAVGAKPKHIVSQFMFEALLISFIGGAFGFLITWGITSVIAAIPVNNPSMEYLGKPELSQLVLFVVLAILSTIGLLAGVFPAMKAAKMDPVESLRYE